MKPTLELERRINRKSRQSFSKFLCISCTSACRYSSPVPVKKRLEKSTHEIETDVSTKLTTLRKFKHYPLLGLSGAGKTTILSKWIPNSENPVLQEPIMPTERGQTTIEKLWIEKSKNKILSSRNNRSRSHKMVLIDTSGSLNQRIHWARICTQSKIGGIFFVLDSTNQHGLYEASVELNSLIKVLDNKNLPIIILANKQDSNKLIPMDRIIQEMDLFQLQNPWKIIQTSATKGQGMQEALINMRTMSKIYRKLYKMEKTMSDNQNQENETLQRYLPKTFSRSDSYYSSASSSESSDNDD